jgi:Ni/Co efflux regulator RcnB
MTDTSQQHERFRMVSLDIALRLYQVRRPQAGTSWTEEDDRHLLETCFRDARALASAAFDEPQHVVH